MTMTRQHFELIAKTLNYSKPSKVAQPLGYKHRLDKWQQIVTSMSYELANTNPSFDRDRFLTACGL